MQPDLNQAWPYQYSSKATNTGPAIQNFLEYAQMYDTAAWIC